ncbi:uncharacterized protein LOC121993005 [Zingiber officinale]|uniref:Uncharacterized protein n=1 Tax=Zingiber officinale TaxID=94328 RepID=A0A8J5L075_ZINOF|nr:uncharacterized protein LOC121993005 [Zingiber officinale]XP_042403605.1 uncharacterized protein LOC121993005 [Zingiber officinale]KAG6496481.1 hypothetical protein ZIOFF_044348 [Zingiber officinale]
MSGFMGAFWGTRALEIIQRFNSAGKPWKRIRITGTRRSNAKKRLRRIWQNESVLRACAEPPQEATASAASAVEHQ